MVAECNGCGDRFIGESILCGDCLDKADPEYSDECFWCEESVEWHEIAVVDYDGYVYCKDCDTGVYCEKCGAPVDKGEEFCGACGESDSESETVVDEEPAERDEEKEPEIVEVPAR